MKGMHMVPGWNEKRIRAWVMVLFIAIAAGGVCLVPPQVHAAGNERWFPVGNLKTNISVGAFAISASGTPYVGYEDNSSGNYYVEEFNGSTWTQVGGSVAEDEGASLAIGPSGTPYLMGFASENIWQYGFPPASETALTPATGGEALSSDTNGTTGTNTYTALTDSVITEGGVGEISSGTIVFDVPYGFSFDPASTITATVTTSGFCSGSGNQPLLVGTGSGSTTETVTPSQTQITINIYQSSAGASGCAGILTLSGVTAQPTAFGKAVGSITIDQSASSASISGVVPGHSDFGDLVEVPDFTGDKLVFGGFSTSVPAGLQIPPFWVLLEDANGDSLTNISIPITVSLVSGTGTPGAVLSGVNTENIMAWQGRANFSGRDALIINLAGTGYQLLATSSFPSISPAESSPFTVTPPVLMRQPSWGKLMRMGTPCGRRVAQTTVVAR
jgi:hypothetical protein